MGSKEKLPGVTFYVEESELGSTTGRVLLTADVSDPELWAAVLERLEGYRVYSIDDFQSALIQALRMENQQQRALYEAHLNSLQEELERLKQQFSVQQGGELNTALGALLIDSALQERTK